jgi:hypothetical protein
MHNSGIPDRFKNDWTEYEKVELFMREVIGGGIIREDVTKEVGLFYHLLLPQVES